MKDDGFGDWRIQAVTTLAKDVPAAYPGGPSIKQVHLHISFQQPNIMNIIALDLLHLTTLL